MHLADIEEVAPGVLVTGGVVPCDGRISWAPPAPAGEPRVLPVNSYVLTRPGGCVMIDTGVPAHQGFIGAALSTLGSALDRLSLVLTRAVEFDSCANTTFLLRTHPAQAVYSHFPSVDWVDFDAALDPVKAAGTEFHPLRVGDAIHIDGRDSGLEVIEPAMRLLQTAWLFDDQSGTLFTSDAFGYATASPAEPSRIVGVPSDDLSGAQVAAGLEPKFGWLKDADTRPTVAALREVFDRFDVQAIAPTIGCVLTGRKAVRRHVDLVLDVLRRWEAHDGL